MEQFLSGSILFRFWNILYNYFIASSTYKVLCVLLNWCKNSTINQLIVRYLAKNSSLKNSLTFRIFSRLFSLFDKLWDSLYIFGMQCGKSSRTISFIKTSFCNDNSFLAYGLLVLFFSFGYGITSLILGNFGVLKLAFCGMGIVIALLLFIGKTRWIAYLNGSIFWRFVLYIFD